GVDLELQARVRRVDHVVRAHVGPLQAQRRQQTERRVPTASPQEIDGTRGVGKWHAELWGRPVRPETGSGKKLEAVGLPAWGDLTKAGRTSRPPPRPSCTLAASTGGGPCRRGGGGCPPCCSQPWWRARRLPAGRTGPTARRAPTVRRGPKVPVAIRSRCTTRSPTLPPTTTRFCPALPTIETIARAVHIGWTSQRTCTGRGGLSGTGGPRA